MGGVGETGGQDPPEKSLNIGFLSNSGPDPLKNQHSIWAIISMPAKHLLNGVSLVVNDDGPLKLVFGPSIDPLIN